MYFGAEKAFQTMKVLFPEYGLDELFATGFTKLFETFYLHEQIARIMVPQLIGAPGQPVHMHVAVCHKMVPDAFSVSAAPHCAARV